MLVVVAHPDDESFALGALIDRSVRLGAEVSVLCLTRGEAS
ncbi:MAG TPA: PIG-L family deacetylase, partial [Ornithinibacter sp.]|nr:PIG-L family deacetylase [Ornithinibacter sp.]HQD68815.1 PIG-L family deacetylase [Ornithinibacter sp.]